MITILKSLFSAGRVLWQNIFRVTIVNKLIKPVWKSIAGTIVVFTSYDYGCWTQQLSKAASEGTSLEGVPIVVSKIHNFFIWFYNLNFIQYLYIFLSNIAYGFKIPIYIVSIFFIILVVFFIVFVVTRSFKAIFKKHELKLFTTNDPKTIMQELISNQNKDFINTEEELKRLRIDSELLKIYQKQYNVLLKDFEKLSKLSNKIDTTIDSFNKDGNKDGNNK